MNTDTLLVSIFLILAVSIVFLKINRLQKNNNDDVSEFDETYLYISEKIYKLLKNKLSSEHNRYVVIEDVGKEVSVLLDELVLNNIIANDIRSIFSERLINSIIYEIIEKYRIG